MRNESDRPSVTEAYTGCVRGRSSRNTWPVPAGSLNLAVAPGLVLWTSESDSELPVASIETFLCAMSGSGGRDRQWRLEFSGEEHHLQSDGRMVYYTVGGRIQWEARGQDCDLLLGIT